MTTTITHIIKRDGLQEPFTPSKIENAVLKAYIATGLMECLQEAKQVTLGVMERIEQEVISVEEVQDLVESNRRSPSGISFIENGVIRNARKKVSLSAILTVS